MLFVKSKLLGLFDSCGGLGCNAKLFKHQVGDVHVLVTIKDNIEPADLLVEDEREAVFLGDIFDAFAYLFVNRFSIRPKMST
jgi:hypothetical protein